MASFEEILMGLILADILATTAGNWAVWMKLSALESRTSCIETKHSVHYPGE